MGWRDRLLNASPDIVGRAMKFGGGRILSQQDLGRGGMNKGGRVGLKHGGGHGKKGTFEKIGEAISRKWRGKEKTEHKGLEQDVKTGAYTHKAPEDRLDTQKGREFLHKVAGWKHGYPVPQMYKNPSKDMSYKRRKKEIAKDKKEAKRKDDFDKKHNVGKYKEKK